MPESLLPPAPQTTMRGRLHLPRYVGAKYIFVQARVCAVFLFESQIYVCPSSYVLFLVPKCRIYVRASSCVCSFWYANVKYMFVQAHLGAVFAIEKSNIYLCKLMYVLFLLSKSQINVCPSSCVCVCVVLVC